MSVNRKIKKWIEKANEVEEVDPTEFNDPVALLTR